MMTAKRSMFYRRTFAWARKGGASRSVFSFLGLNDVAFPG